VCADDDAALSHEPTRFKTLGRVFQVSGAHALKLPCRLTEDVKVKAPQSAVLELYFDFKFDVVVSSWLVTESARLLGSGAAPHPYRCGARQLVPSDAISGDEPQFVFESG
jgi:hypothetical protein